MMLGVADPDRLCGVMVGTQGSKHSDLGDTALKIDQAAHVLGSGS